MALDPTVLETQLRASVKKFFVDNMETENGVKVGFDRTVSPPAGDHKQWVNVSLDNIIVKQVSDAVLNIYLFTRDDIEGTKLSQLRDTLFQYLYEGYIDYYDSEWNKVGGMLLFIDEESGIQYVSDSTKMKSLIATLRWSALI